MIDRLERATGLSLAGLEPWWVERGLSRRMEATGAGGLDGYLELLDRDPSERARLGHSIFLNVTGFFRDPDAWAVLGREGLPGIAAARPDGAIRVWSAGCASGEEPYTAAMVAAEALGRGGLDRRLRVDATDVDPEALRRGRRAVYGRRRVQAVPRRLRRRYLRRRGSGFVPREELRRTVVFSSHDLASDPPIPDVDLVICRQTLMYFDPPTRRRVLGGFADALREGGVLFCERTDDPEGDSDGAFASLGLGEPLFAPTAR